MLPRSALTQLAASIRPPVVAALSYNTTGQVEIQPTVLTRSLSSNTSGNNNTGNRERPHSSKTLSAFKTRPTVVVALLNNTTGTNNTATGFQALMANTTGGFNTAVGLNALVNNTGGSSNTALGDSAGFNVTTADHVICIGANVQGENVSNTCYIGNIFSVTSIGGSGVFVNADGKLGTATSSRRFKEEIKPMEDASEALLALKPVTFCYKREIDPAGKRQLGLVAEDVEAVDPDLVVRDKEGKAYSVRYEQVNAMLLNEFLKEHRTVMELKKEIATLTATVKEQAEQIRKVSDYIATNKSAPQIVPE